MRPWAQDSLACNQACWQDSAPSDRACSGSEEGNHSQGFAPNHGASSGMLNVLFFDFNKWADLSVAPKFVV